MEQLTLNDKRPVTASGQVGVVMRLASGQGADSQWFDYVTHGNFFDPPTRIEWDKDTMNVVLPAATADYLIRNGLARVMTGPEARAYNRGLNGEKKEIVT